LDRRIIWDTC